MVVDWRDCPVIDGVLQIDNALELQGSRGLERSPNDLSIINYTFRGGEITLKSPLSKLLISVL
jgi:hypothetical protein